MLPTPKGFLHLPSRPRHTYSPTICDSVEHSRQQREGEGFRGAQSQCVSGRWALTTASYAQSLEMSERRSHFNAFFRERYRCFKTLCHGAYRKLSVSVCTGLNHFSSLRNFCKQLLGQRVAFEMRHNTGKKWQPAHWITKHRRSLETWLVASQPYLLVIVFFLLISPVFI